MGLIIRENRTAEGHLLILFGFQETNVEIFGVKQYMLWYFITDGAFLECFMLCLLTCVSFDSELGFQPGNRNIFPLLNWLIMGTYLTRFIMEVMIIVGIFNYFVLADGLKNFHQKNKLQILLIFHETF